MSTKAEMASESQEHTTKVLATSLCPFNSAVGLIFKLWLLSAFPDFWINHTSRSSTKCSWCKWLYIENVKTASFLGTCPVSVSTIRLR